MIWVPRLKEVLHDVLCLTRTDRALITQEAFVAVISYGRGAFEILQQSVSVPFHLYSENVCAAHRTGRHGATSASPPSSSFLCIKASSIPDHAIENRPWCCDCELFERL